MLTLQSHPAPLQNIALPFTLVFGGPSGTITQATVDEGYNAGDWRFALQQPFTLPAGTDGYYFKVMGSRITTGNTMNFVYVKELSEEVYTPPPLCIFGVTTASNTVQSSRTWTNSTCGASLTLLSPSIQPGVAAGQTTCTYTPTIYTKPDGVLMTSYCNSDNPLQIGLKAPSSSITIRSLRISFVEVGG